MIRFIAVFALILLGFAPPPQAAEINDDGAQHLQSMFSDIISYQKNVSQLTRGRQYIYQGDVSVEPAEDYYAITLPHISILYPAGRRVEIGMISINAIPHKEDKKWKMTVAMPTPISVFNKAGETLTQIDIGSQLSAGIWHEDMGHFVKLDARYHDISIENMESGYQTTIPKMEVIYDLTEDENGKWSGPANFSLENIDVNGGDNGTKVSIDKIRTEIELNNYDPVAMQDYRGKLLALSKTSDEANNESQGHKASGIYGVALDLFGKASAGFKMQYNLSGFDMTRPGDEEEESTEKIHIGKAVVGLGINGFLEDNLTIDLRLGYDDLKLSLEQEDTMAELFPTSNNFDIQIDNIPYKQISTLGRNSLSGVMEQMAGISFMLKVPAILSQAGTTIILDDNHFGNHIYKVGVSGKIRADISALNSATADIQMAVEGLEALKAKISGKTEHPDIETAQDFERLAAQLQILQLMAKQEKSEAGKVLHILNFEMNPQGQMLVNGQDIKLLFDPKAGERAKPQPDPPEPEPESTQPDPPANEEDKE